MSARTEALMVNTPIKAQQVALKEMTDEMRATRPGFEWKLDLERARLVTESYKLSENERGNQTRLMKIKDMVQQREGGV